MAYDLVARFNLVDQFTRPMRNMTQQLTQFNRIASTATNGASSVTSALGRQASQTQSLTSSIANMTGAQSASTMAAGRQSSSIGRLIGTVGGLAAAYISARGAVSLFNSTVGAAASYEQQKVVTSTMFGDDGQAKAYLKLMDDMALKSAVLNSNDMMVGSKAYVGLTKNLGQLEKMWNITEKLQAFSGVDTQQASFSLKEALQGDYISIVDAIGIDKKAMQKIVKMDGVDAKITAMTALLDKMGVTDSTLEAMSNTTLGRWSAITEKIGMTARSIGDAPNTALGDFLGDLLGYVEKIDVTSLANSVGTTLSNAFNKATNVFNATANAIKYVKENKDGLISSAKMALSVLAGVTTAVVTFRTVMGTMAIIGTVTTLLNAYRAGTLLATAATLGFNTTLLANPIGVVVAGVSALIGVGVALAMNWDTVTAKTKEFWSAIGGLEGALRIVTGPLGVLIGAAVDLAKNWDSTKSVWENVWGAMKRSAETTVNSVIGLINSMIDAINNIPFIEIDAVANVNWSGSAVQGPMPAQGPPPPPKKRPGHYFGLANVAYDGYEAVLHRNERILTAPENKAYSAMFGSSVGGILKNLVSPPTVPNSGLSGVANVESGVSNVAYDQSSSVTNEYSYANYMTQQQQPQNKQTQPQVVNIHPTINGTFYVREDADITRIADQLVSKILAKRVSFG